LEEAHTVRDQPFVDGTAGERNTDETYTAILETKLEEISEKKRDRSSRPGMMVA
jgi:hypothetical protein